MRMATLAAVVAAGVAGVLSGAPQDASAQPVTSYNCSRAKTFVEKAICQSPSLAEKDRKMSSLYFSTLADHKNNAAATRALKADQRAWLARRDKCTTMGCLERSYDGRIAELTNWTY